MYKIITLAFLGLFFALTLFASAAASPLPAGKTLEEAEIDKALDINKADIKELVKVKGMDSTKARAVIAYRKKHGAFKGFSELSRVRGFEQLSPGQLKEIQDQLRIG